MDIGAYLYEIATTYDPHAPLGSAAQRMLRSAEDYLQEHLPGGLLVRGSGGTGTATFTPWIGLFDPDETTTPQDGVYIVYLFAEDLESVVLSLQQGITRLTRDLGQGRARDRLAADADAIREHLPDGSLTGMSAVMRLRSSGYRQRAYEAGSIAAIEYSTRSLPPEEQMRADLNRFIELYEAVVTTKRHLLQAEPGAIASSSVVQVTRSADPLRHFKPKSDADYIAHIAGKELRKTRRHETLVREFGELMRERGFQPSTPHPLDLVLTKGGSDWLIEAKVVYGGDATSAVRAAVGQLLCYRHFHFGAATVSLVGLFSESIGQAYVDFLDQSGITSVWKEGGDWRGSARAIEDGLATPAGSNREQTRTE